MTVSFGLGRRRCELVSLCSRDVAAITDVWNLLERELEVNTEELEVTSRKNAEMVYVLSMAIPTLKGLLNSVRVRLTTNGVARGGLGGSNLPIEKCQKNFRR